MLVKVTANGEWQVVGIMVRRPPKTASSNNVPTYREVVYTSMRRGTAILSALVRHGFQARMEAGDEHC
jgi:hypothetical protein